MSLKLFKSIRPLLTILTLLCLPSALLSKLTEGNPQLLIKTQAAEVSVASSSETLESLNKHSVGEVRGESGQVDSSVTVMESKSAVLGASSDLARHYYSELFGPKTIGIEIEGYKMNAVTYFSTVSEIIEDLGINVDEDDIVLPALEEPISNISQIKYIKVDSITEESVEEVPFTVEYKDNPEVEWGEEVVTQKGITGKIIHSLKKIFHNGQYVGTLDLGVSTIPPINEVVSKGQKIVEKILTLDDGTEFKYCRVIRMKVTAYDSSCAGCNNITALGYELKKGIVAVDPKVIPLRSSVYVPGYGVGFAADVGGAVKGNIIDVGFATPEERLANWGGTKYDDVYVACPSQ